MIQGSSVKETYEMMQAKLSEVVPDVELYIKAELVYEINRLKKEKNAVILGHNYMEPALFHPGLCRRFLGIEPASGGNRQRHYYFLRGRIHG